MRYAAAAVGVSAGAIELVLAVMLAMAEGGIKTQLLGDFGTAVSIVIPLIMMAGGALSAFNRPAWLPAGILIMGWAVQRLMLLFSSVIIAPSLLVLLAFAMGMLLDHTERHPKDHLA